MLFLLKCLIFLGIVLLAIAAREGGEKDGHAHVAARAPAHGAAAGDIAAGVGAAHAALSKAADRAVERATEAARDHCLAHPLDCLRAAEKLHAAKTEASGR